MRRRKQPVSLTAALVAGLMWLVVMVAIFATPMVSTAQEQAAPGAAARKPKSGKERVTRPALEAAKAGDRDDVLFDWLWYMGMLRGPDEAESVATFDLRKSTGTIFLAGQPCKLANYRVTINYQMLGMRTQYSCTRADGLEYKNGEVVAGQYAWDEDAPGAGLEAGRGTATPKPNAVAERQIRLWASPQGAPKAAVAGGENTKVGVEDGKVVVTYPIPFNPGVMAKATLNSQNQAERVEVLQQGKVTMEFLYENYGDFNPVDDRIDCFFPGHIVEKVKGATVLDINVSETATGNIYVVIPVPDSVMKAEPGATAPQGAS